MRAGHFLPQCENERKVDAQTTGWGLSLLSLGLFQKVVLADALLAARLRRLDPAAGLAHLADGQARVAHEADEALELKMPHNGPGVVNVRFAGDAHCSADLSET